MSQANSRLLTVARDEAELAKFRVWESRRALFPALTARVSSRSARLGQDPSDGAVMVRSQ